MCIADDNAKNSGDSGFAQISNGERVPKTTSPIMNDLLNENTWRTENQ